MKEYLRATRSATYSFWAALPLLLAYEVLITMANAGRSLPIRVGADVWTKRLIQAFGVVGHLWLGIAVLLLGMAIYFSERDREIRLRPLYFTGMLGECLVLALALPLLVQYVLQSVTERLPQLQAGGGLTAQPLVMQVALSLGAGLYEEFIFRVLLFGGLYLAFKGLTHSKVAGMLAAAVLGSLLFSAVHYIGSLGDPWDWWSFSYRFLFGLLLTGLYAARGFGIAAWTHALYDLSVVVTTYYGSQ